MKTAPSLVREMHQGLMGQVDNALHKPSPLNTLRVSPVFIHPAGETALRVASWFSDGCAYAVWSRIF